MQIVYEEALRLIDAGERFVLATVVATRGSTPQKPGAKLLVRRDGTITGTLGGGCVEADVRIEARRALDGGDARPSTRRFRLTEEIAWKDGLVCGGTMDIIVEPIAGAADERAAIERIVGAFGGRGDCAVATRYTPAPIAAEVEIADDSALRNGAAFERLYIDARGGRRGGLGDGAPEADVVAIAGELMPRGRDRLLELADGSRIYIEAYTRPATVVIAGGGHVGRAIHTVARFVGLRTIIVDDRPDFANAERFPDADRVVADDFDRGLRSLELGPNHYVVIATRGHKLDDVALTEAARSKAGYVGLLGSRRKAALILREMMRSGIPEARLAEIRTPVGLDLGGRQPEEIALSIVAEIVAERNRRDAAPLNFVTEELIAKLRTANSRSR